MLLDTFISLSEPSKLYFNHLLVNKEALLSDSFDKTKSGLMKSMMIKTVVHS